MCRLAFASIIGGHCYFCPNKTHMSNTSNCVCCLKALEAAQAALEQKVLHFSR